MRETKRPSPALEQLLDAAAEQLMTPSAAERLKRLAARQQGRKAPRRPLTRAAGQAAAWQYMAEAFATLAERAAFMAHEAREAESDGDEEI